MTKRRGNGEGSVCRRKDGLWVGQYKVQTPNGTKTKYIAGGNVIFNSPAKDTQTLEKTIEDHLRQSLGYDVITFVGSASELARKPQKASNGFQG